MKRSTDVGNILAALRHGAVFALWTASGGGRRDIGAALALVQRIYARPDLRAELVQLARLAVAGGARSTADADRARCASALYEAVRADGYSRRTATEASFDVAARETAAAGRDVAAFLEFALAAWERVTGETTGAVALLEEETERCD